MNGFIVVRHVIKQNAVLPVVFKRSALYTNEDVLVHTFKSEHGSFFVARSQLFVTRAEAEAACALRALGGAP